MAMKIGDLFVRLGMDMTEFSKGLQDAQKELKQQAESLQTTGSTLTAAVTLPLAGIATASVAAFAGFESSMNRVSALGDIFGKDLQKLTDQAMDLGAKTQYSAKQAADAMGNLAAAGFKTNEIYAAMPGVLSLAATENMKIADAAQIAADVLKGFQLQASDMGKVADVLAKTSAASSNSVTDLGYAFSYVGPVAKVVGLSFLDTAAALGVLGDAGVRGERGGTALRNILNDIVAPSAKAEGIMAGLGIQVKDATGKLKDMAGIVQALQPLLKNAAAAKEIFGQRWSEVLPLLQKSGTAFASMRKEVENFEGSAKSMADIIRKGVAGNFEEFTSSLETAGIQLGKILAPLANQLIKFGIEAVNGISNAIEWFGKLPVPIQQFTIAALGLAAVTGPLLVLSGSMLGAVANLKLLGPALTAAGTAILSFGKNATTGSTAIGSFVKSLAEINVSQGLSTFKTTMEGIGNAVINGVKNLPGSLSKAKDALISFGSTAAGSLASTSKDIAASFMKMSSSALEFTKTAFSKEGLTKAMTMISTSATSLVTSLTGGNGIVGALANMRTAFMSIGPLVVGLGISLGTFVVVAGALAAAGYLIYKNWSDIKAVLSAFWDDMVRIVSGVAQKIMKWIEATFGKEAAGYIMKVWEGVKNFFVSVWNGIVSIFQNGMKWILEISSTVAKALDLTSTAAALDKWRQKLDGVTTNLKQVGGTADEALGKMSGGFKKVTGASEETGASLGSLPKKMSKAEKEAAAELKKFKGKLEDVKDVADRVADRLENIPRTFKDFSKAMEGGGFNAKSAIKGIEEAWADLERKIARESDPKIKAALKGQAMALRMAADELKKYKEEWDSAELEKLAEAMETAVSEGIRKADVSDVLVETLTPALMAEKAIDQLADAYKDLGLTLDQVRIKGGNVFSETAYAADKALESYNLIARSGVATAKELDKAWRAYLEKKVAAEKEANSQIRIESDGLLNYILANASQSAAEYQLEILKATDQFASTMQSSLKNVFSTVFSGDFSGILGSLKKLGSDFVSGFENVLLAPAKAMLDKFIESISTGIADWLTENVFKVISRGFGDVLSSGNALAGLFRRLFGGEGVVDAAKSADAAAKAVGAAVNAANAAAKTSTQVAQAAKQTAEVAGQAAKASKDAAGAVTDASKAATSAAKSALSTIQSVTGVVSGIVSAVTGVLSYLQGRRMEQDLGRIEVTTRGQLNQLISIQETLNKYLPGIQGINDFLGGTLISAFASLMSTTEEIRDRMTEAVKILRSGVPVNGGNVTTTPEEGDPPPSASVPNPDREGSIALLDRAREREIRAINASIAAEQAAAQAKAGNTVVTDNNTTITDDNTLGSQLNTGATTANTAATTANTAATNASALSLDNLSAAQAYAAKEMGITKDVWARLKEMSDEEIARLAAGSAETEKFLKDWRDALKKGGKKAEDFADTVETVTYKTENSFVNLSSAATTTATSLRETSSDIQYAAKSIYEDVKVGFGDSTRAFASGVDTLVAGVKTLSLAFVETEQSLQARIDAIVSAGGEWADMQHKIFSLQTKINNMRGGTTNTPGGLSPGSPTTSYWGAPLGGISTTPIITMNVNVNNADAQQVANTMVSTFRGRGVDI